jgi:hypothetical protein
MSGLLATLIVAALHAGEPLPSVGPPEPAGEPPASETPAAAVPGRAPVVVEPKATTSIQLEPSAEEPASVPTVVAPPPDARFGDTGEMVINGALSGSIGHLGYSSSGSSTTSFGIEPAFDYFSSRNLSQGASAFFRYNDSSSGINLENKSVTFGITGHLAFNLWLGDRVSLWPRLAVGVWRSQATYYVPPGTFTVSVDGKPFSISSGTEISEDAVFVELYAPFLFHLAQHFFVGFGPQAYTDLFHSANSLTNRRMFVGAESTIGGWF